jgi:hypothetical protein
VLLQLALGSRGSLFALLIDHTDSSTVSNNMGLQLQTILNAEDSPTRNVPDTPSSARHQAAHPQQVRRSQSRAERANSLTSTMRRFLPSIKVSETTA